MTRLIWLLTGIAWAATSMIALADADYQDPKTILDWGAVWAYTMSLILLAPSVLSLARLAGSRSVDAIATVSAIATVVAGVANLLEDGLGMKFFGAFYLVGFMTALLSLLPLAFTLWRARAPRLALLMMVLFLGIATFTLGGGVIVLGAFAALSLRPAWFQPGATAARPAPGVPPTTASA